MTYWYSRNKILMVRRGVDWAKFKLKKFAIFAKILFHWSNKFVFAYTTYETKESAEASWPCASADCLVLYVGYVKTSLFDQWNKIYYFQDFKIYIFLHLWHLLANHNCLLDPKCHIPKWPPRSDGHPRCFRICWWHNDHGEFYPFQKKNTFLWMVTSTNKKTLAASRTSNFWKHIFLTCPCESFWAGHSGTPRLLVPPIQIDEKHSIRFRKDNWTSPNFDQNIALFKTLLRITYISAFF